MLQLIPDRLLGAVSFAVKADDKTSVLNKGRFCRVLAVLSYILSEATGSELLNSTWYYLKNRIGNLEGAVRRGRSGKKKV